MGCVVERQPTLIFRLSLFTSNSAKSNFQVTERTTHCMEFVVTQLRDSRQFWNFNTATSKLHIQLTSFVLETGRKLRGSVLKPSWETAAESEGFGLPLLCHFVTEM